MDNFDLDEVFNADDYLYFYRDFLTEKRTKSEVEFYIKEAKLTKSCKILDLACGHGRHSNLLSEYGYNITGVDINSNFLEIAKKKCKNKKSFS